MSCPKDLSMVTSDRPRKAAETSRMAWPTFVALMPATASSSFKYRPKFLPDEPPVEVCQLELIVAVIAVLDELIDRRFRE